MADQSTGPTQQLMQQHSAVDTEEAVAAPLLQRMSEKAFGPESGASSDHSSPNSASTRTPMSASQSAASIGQSSLTSNSPWSSPSSTRTALGFDGKQPSQSTALGGHAGSTMPTQLDERRSEDTVPSRSASTAGQLPSSDVKKPSAGPQAPMLMSKLQEQLPAAAEKPPALHAASQPSMNPGAFLRGLNDIQNATIHQQHASSPDAVQARAVLQESGYNDMDAAQFKRRLYQAYEDGRLKATEKRFNQAHLDAVKALKAPLHKEQSGFAEWTFQKFFAGHQLPPPPIGTNDESFDYDADAVNHLRWHCFP